MDTIAVPLMLTLGAVTFLTAVVGLVGWVSDQLFGNKQAAYWWRITAGVCFITQAMNGALAVRYLAEGRVMLAFIVLLLLALGMWLLNLGLRVRKLVLTRKS